MGESESETTAQRPAIVSSGDLLGSARTLRTLQRALELTVVAIVAGSVAAIGSVHAPAYTVLWVACFVAFALTLLRALAIGGLRQRLGPHRVALHVSGRWLVVEPHEDDHALGWSIDLREPALPRGALLRAGDGVPRPRAAAARAAGGVRRAGDARAGGDAARNHVPARAADAARSGGRRLRPAPRLAALPPRAVVARGGALAAGARAARERDLGSSTGGSSPSRAGQPFGPFVNRNHFAGYMLLVLPIALGLLAAAWRAYARRAGGNPNTRRRLVALASPEGTALVYAALPPLLGIGALVASTSRGGILAFVFALAIAVVGVRSRRGMPGWVAALLFAGMVLSWFGLERLELRFVRAADDAPGRTVIWRESLAALHGPRWATGYGFDAFAEAISRVPAWQLPKGATPWPAPVDAALRSGARLGYRAPGDLPGLDWYREAHNDFLQLLVETGVPGLLIGLWGALAALHAARRDPWRFAALAGVLMHAFVDFDLQIPAISALLVVLAAVPRR